MKLKILFISILTLMSTSCFAVSLTWGMKLDNFEKNFKIEEKYETDLYSIIYLPRNSIYGNEFDEYLLFTKDIWISRDNYLVKSDYEGQFKRLIRRLQVTDYTVEECKKLIKRNTGFSEKENKEKDFDFPLKEICPEEDALLGFENFPSKFSFPVLILLLTKPYNYAILSGKGNDLQHHKYSNHWFDKGWGWEYFTGIFLQDGNNYLMCYDYDSVSFFRELSYSYYKDYTNQIEEIRKQFPSHIEEVKLSNLQKNNLKGPFGTFWNIPQKDFYLISKENKKRSGNSTDLGELQDKINYQDYYSVFSNAGITTVKKFIPQKSVDFISDYYAIFDNNNGLYQIFTIVNYSRGITEKEIHDNRQINTKQFGKIKSILTEQYGNPKEKSKDSVYWIAENNIKIELFSESKIVELINLINGKKFAGVDDYTCLVYTDTNKYDNLLVSEKDLIEQKKKEESEAVKKKEIEQKSYF